MKRETVYGQAASGNYVRIPFNRCTLGSEQGLIDDPVLARDVIRWHPSRTSSTMRARSWCRSIPAI
jgi:hypothetical protein